MSTNPQIVEPVAAAESQVRVTIQVIDPPSARHDFRLDSTAALLEMMQMGAAEAGVALLPPGGSPLDLLHNYIRHDELGPPIEDLDQSVGPFVRQPHTTANFAIELVLAFRVNNRWAIATAVEMSPRQILALPAIGLNFAEYTLYLPDSAVPLPLDTPIRIERGMALEAQKDGKYGGA